MKLDCNANENGQGKYALLKLRQLEYCRSPETFARYTPEIEAALRVLEAEGALDWGGAPETEFFVIRLKDINAQRALEAYAESAAIEGDRQFAAEVLELASRAGPRSPHCKRPD